MGSATDHAFVLWMEHDGDIYSPAMNLSRSSEAQIERDLWDGAYPGICHRVYSYGTHANGGSYCREVTQDIAARLGRWSLTSRREPAESVRAFLEACGVEHFGEGQDFGAGQERGGRDLAPHRPFEMQSPRSNEPTRRAVRRKRRARPLTPEELRAEPQFKLPILGGKEASSARLDNTVEGNSSAVPRAASECEEQAGVEQLSLKDERPIGEQEAAWQRFDRKMREMGITVARDPGRELPKTGSETEIPRKAAVTRS